MDTTHHTLSPYEICELVGTGAFGSVYRAVDPRLNCDVAIKILADNHALNPDIRERFLREAQALRKIDSPNVVSLFDIGETPDGRPYLVLEFADCGGLIERRRQSVNSGAEPTAADVAYLITALADALEPMHAEQLVHRDVTPYNILIRSTNRPEHAATPLFGAHERLMLSDLGLVKDLVASSGLTVGTGTAGFASPEQQQLVSTIDGRSDIYSATAVVLWLMTGQSPIITGHVDDHREELNWPQPFLDALAHGLAEQPANRHATIIDWKDDLLSALPITEPAEPETGGARTLQYHRNPQGRRHERLRLLGAGLLGGIAASVATLSIWPDNPTQPTDEVLGVVNLASSPVSLTNPPLALAETPAAPNIEANGSELTWDGVDGATGYNIYHDDNYLSTVQSPRYTAAQAGTYYVTAFDNEATPTRYSVRSNQVSVDVVEAANATLEPRPSPPVIEIDGTELTWIPVNGADGYIVYLDGYYLATIVEGTSYTMIEPGNYSITAFNTDADPTVHSKRSNEVTVTAVAVKGAD